MAAGVADFTIEQGADWSVQIYWQSEQTGQPIHAQGPMDMDIVSSLTGQRLIRLDDGSNGGIVTSGASYGIIQLEIDRNTTVNFAVGNYIYDLYAYSAGPPLQRIRLLRGSVAVAAAVTDLGVQMGQLISAGVLPPDIILDTTAATNVVNFKFDNNDPTNQGDGLENGKPFRAGLTGPGSYPVGSTVQFVNEAGQSGPVRNPSGGAITASQVNNWLAAGAIITVTYTGQTYGLTVSKVESTPGAAPSPPTLLVASTDSGGE